MNHLLRKMEELKQNKINYSKDDPNTTNCLICGKRYGIKPFYTELEKAHCLTCINIVELIKAFEKSLNSEETKKYRKITISLFCDIKYNGQQD